MHFKMKCVVLSYLTAFFLIRCISFIILHKGPFAPDSTRSPIPQHEPNQQEELRNIQNIPGSSKIIHFPDASVTQPFSTVTGTPDVIAVELINDFGVNRQNEEAHRDEPNTNVADLSLLQEKPSQEVSFTAATIETDQQVQTVRTSEEHSEVLVDDYSTAANLQEEQQSVSSWRDHPRDITLHKSSKKHASTEMKFRYFEVNWNKLSDHLLIRLSTLQKFRNEHPGVFPPPRLRFAKTEVTQLVNAVVDQLRIIDTQIRAETMENVSRQIIQKFPCLDSSDDDGYGAGQGFVELKYKMIHRNNYLNRYGESHAAPIKPISSKKSRNARAGTIKEYYELTSMECDKAVLSILKRDEPNLLTEEFLGQSQAYVRFRLDEKISTAKMVSQLPVVRRRTLLNYHFEKATGKDVSLFRNFFSSKRDKIIQYSLTCQPNLHLKNSSSDVDVLKFLCSLVGENFVDLVIPKEVRDVILVLIFFKILFFLQIGTRIDDITVGSPGPVLISVG